MPTNTELNTPRISDFAGGITNPDQAINKLPTGIPSSAAPCTLGDLTLFVMSEQVNREALITDYPTERRESISDHRYRKPITAQITILFASRDDSFKAATQRLHDMHAKDEMNRYTTIIPPGSYENMMIEHIGTTYKKPGSNAFYIDLSLKQVTFANLTDSVAIGTDPVTVGSLAGPPRDYGKQSVKQPLVKPAAGAAQKSSGGGLFGGLGSLVGNIFDTAKKALEIPFVKDIVVGVGKKILANVPGAGIVMDALSGNLNWKSVVKGVASLIPGGGTAADLLFTGIDIYNKVQSGGLVQGALDALGLPKGVSNLVSGLVSGKGVDGILKDVGGSFLSGALDSISKSVPGVGDIAKLAAQWISTGKAPDLGQLASAAINAVTGKK